MAKKGALNKAMGYNDLDSCLSNKPALRTKKTWEDACYTAHPSMQSGPNETDNSGGSKKAIIIGGAIVTVLAVVGVILFNRKK